MLLLSVVAETWPLTARQCRDREPCAYVVFGRFLYLGQLDGVGHEAENGTNPQQHGETPKELLAKFDPFWSRLGGRKRVRPIAF